MTTDVDRKTTDILRELLTYYANHPPYVSTDVLRLGANGRKVRTTEYVTEDHGSVVHRARKILAMQEERPTWE